MIFRDLSGNLLTVNNNDFKNDNLYYTKVLSIYNFKTACSVYSESLISNVLFKGNKETYQKKERETKNITTNDIGM